MEESHNIVSEEPMSRPLLLVTGVFYLFMGYTLVLLPIHHLTIIRSTFEAIATNDFTQYFLGVSLLTAGAFTLVAAFAYRNNIARIVAAGLRAGSMCGLEILVILVWLFLPNGSFLSVIIFGYLSILSLLTLPPSNDDAILKMNRTGG